MLSVDPVVLAARQLRRDRERTQLLPGLFEHKAERMRASPLAFLRGTAPLFYELLAAHPELERGPAGVGWIAGDLHLENFGAYRPGSLVDEVITTRVAKKARKQHGAEHAMFNLNDFDDAFIGPWRVDVLRLIVSLLLGSRELGVRGVRAVELCESLLVSYVKHATGAAKPPPMPRPVAALVDAVRTRTRVQLLEARTRVVKRQRQFVRGDRYRDVGAKLRIDAESAFADYVKRLAKSEPRIDAAHYEVLDVAYRIAGTGSLGGLRVGVLVRGKGGPDGAWIFDMKEQGIPSGAALFGKPDMKPAKRVVTAMRACLEHPPRMLGTTKLRGRSIFVRRLAPQEDKLDLARIDDVDLEPLSAYLGALTGDAHRRGATRAPKKPWKASERDALLEHAIAVAGVYEASYLAYFKQCR